jgi:hypothetical protein
MFAAVITGAMLGGKAHSAAGTCQVGYSTANEWPWMTQTACPVPKNRKKTTTSATALAACAVRVPTIPFAVLAGGEEALSPPARADTATTGPPGTC